jgi:hypothetical protein
MKQIAAKLGVSPSSVFHWTRDIELTDEQRRRNIAYHYWLKILELPPLCLRGLNQPLPHLD